MVNLDGQKIFLKMLGGRHKDAGRVSCRISPFGGGELKDFGGSSLGVGG